MSRSCSLELVPDRRRLSTGCLLPAAGESCYDTSCSVISLAGKVVLGMDGWIVMVDGLQ